MIKRFTHKEIFDGVNRVNRDGIAGFAEAVLISLFDPTKMFIKGLFFNEVGDKYALIYVELATPKDKIDEGESFPFDELTEIDLQGITASFLLKSAWYDFIVIN